MFVKAIKTQKLKEARARYDGLSTGSGYLFQALPSELKPSNSGKEERGERGKRRKRSALAC